MCPVEQRIADYGSYVCRFAEEARRFSGGHLLILLDIAQRVALSVEADQFAVGLEEAAKTLSGDDEV